MIRKCLLILICLAAIMNNVVAQDTEFWFAPPYYAYSGSNTYKYNGGFVINNPSNSQATVIIHYYSNNTEDTISVPPRSYYHFRYMMKADLQTNKKLEIPWNTSSSKFVAGAHITSTVPISVYYIMDYSAVQETMVLKGHGGIGTKFSVAHATGQKHYRFTSNSTVAENPYISIIGTEDGTTVNLDLKASVTLYPAGKSQATLNKGEVLFLRASNKNAVLSGSVITADKPVTVTAGEFMGTNSYADFVFDQLVQDDLASTIYVMPLSAGFTSSSLKNKVVNYVDMIAMEDSTDIYINWGDGNTLLASGLSAGQTFQTDTFNVMRGKTCATITATKPIHCQQISGAEASVCHIPNFNSTNTSYTSFFSYFERWDNNNIYPAVMLLYQESGRNDFTISYDGQPKTDMFGWISTNGITDDSQGDVPGIADWKFIRFTLPDDARNKMITIENSSSVFQLGFSSSFYAGTNISYFSSFDSDFSFKYDTVFKCAGSTYKLIGGVGKNYEWTFPDGSKQSGILLSSIDALDEGQYILKMQKLDDDFISDTCYVKDIKFQGSLTNKDYIPGNPYTPNVQLNPELQDASSITLEYEWTFSDDAIPTTSTDAEPSVIWATVGAKTVTLHLTAKSMIGESVNCDTTMTYTLNLALKESTLNGVQHNGFLGNPITVLGNEIITYKLKGVNVAKFIDVLPGYMNYVGPVSPTVAPDVVPPPTDAEGRQILTWTRTGTSTLDSVVFNATPVPGVCASQPLFFNQAGIVTHQNDTILTNETYHQGGGIAIVTFSAGLNGELFNAEPQAVDFKSAVEGGVLIVPDEGYEFAGWKHKAYTSMRDSIIPAKSGIMNLDTLTIYGNVELTAVFVREGTVANETVAVETQNFASLQQNKIWSTDNTLYVKATNSGSIISIYNTAGILIRQLTAVGDGTTEIQMPSGVYIVSVNGEPGKKVRIN